MALQLATLESPMERCGHHLGEVSTNLGGVSTRIASRAHAVVIELLPLKSSSSTSTVALLLVSVAEVGSGTPVYRACSAASGDMDCGSCADCILATESSSQKASIDFPLCC